MEAAAEADMAREGTAAVVVAVNRSLGSAEPRGWCSTAGSTRMDLCCWDHMAAAVAVAAAFAELDRRLCIRFLGSGIAVAVGSRLARDRLLRGIRTWSVGSIRRCWPCLAVYLREALAPPGSRSPFVGCGF